MPESGKAQVMIVVFHSRQEPWEEIARKGQLPTWVNNSLQHGYDVRYCYGINPNRFVSAFDNWVENLRWQRGPRVSDFRNVINRLIAYPFRSWIPRVEDEYFVSDPFQVPGLRVNILDTYATGRWRQIALFNYFISKTDHKFLVMVSTASYINTDNLKSLLDFAGLESFYAGPTYNRLPHEAFVSGAFTVVNRNFATKAVRSVRDIPTSQLNDLGLGKAARTWGITPISLPTLNLETIKEVRSLSREALTSNCHYRLKSFENGKRNDISLFTELQKKVQEANNQL